MGHAISNLALGVGQSFLCRMEGVGHVLFINHISKCSGPPSPILFDQSLTTIIVYVPSKATKEKSPKLQHIAPFFISQSSFCKLTDDQNNEKPRRDGQKIFLDPWFEHSFPWVAFLTYSQNFSFVGVHKYWFNRWSKMVSVEFHFARTRASRTGNKEVNKWCDRHA